MDAFRFNVNANRFFGSVSGAGSVVTENDEARKSQITVTRHENEIISSYFDEIPVGSKASLQEEGKFAESRFRLYPTGEEIDLVLLHPKPERNELRIYMKAGVFKPEAGLIWFVFKNDNEIWIGALDEYSMSEILEGSEKTASQNTLLDFSDDEYQDVLRKTLIPETITQTITRIKRDPRIAQEALRNSGYTCEMLPRYDVFTSRSNGEPYLEAHHLIPIAIQPKFESSLDVIENICILNPYAHKMVHHATYSEIRAHIQKLAAPREGFLNSLKLNVDDVLRIYGGE